MILMKNGNILKVSLEGQGVNIVVYLNVKMQEMFRMYVFHWVKLMLDHWSFWDSVFETVSEHEKAWKQII